MFYWIESVQGYSVDGWDYLTELRTFVEGGMTDQGFIDGVSGIVNRGCHNPVRTNTYLSTYFCCTLYTFSDLSYFIVRCSHAVRAR
jgi:hypothetical protein